MTQYELNLRDYIRIFRKRKVIIIISMVISIGAAAFISTRHVPYYQAVTTVKYEERKTTAGRLDQWMSYNPADVLESQTKIIKGYPVMKKVAKRMGMIREDSTEDEINQAISDVTNRIETELIGRTNIIKITATSYELNEVVALANAVAATYVEENLLEKNKQARTVRQFVEEQLASLEARLQESEEKLKQFGEDVENIEVAEPIQRKLVDAEFELAGLLQKYTEKHPRVRQVKEQIADLKKQVRGLSSEQIEYARLKREVEVNRKLYAMLKERLEQARISEAEKIPDVTIIDPAVMAISSVTSRGSLVFVLGGVMGLIIGSMLAFVRETLDTSIGTIEDVETITKLPVLGVVPSISYGTKKEKGLLKQLRRHIFPVQKTEEQERYIRLIVHHKPASPMAEAFRNIRTNVKINPSKKVILIASTFPQEGKTTILINLGLVICNAISLRSFVLCLLN